MKTFLLTAVLGIAHLCSAQVSPTATAPTMRPRADNLYHVADAPGADFDSKLQACYEASDRETPDIIRVYIDWKGSSWEMKKPADWKPRHGSQLRVVLEGFPIWNLIEWQGESGSPASRIKVWDFTGAKESSITGLKGYSRSNYLVWMTNTTSPTCQSSSDVLWSDCRFQPFDGTVGSVGFWLGNSEGPGGNDHNSITVQRCKMEFYPTVSSDNGAIGAMEASLRGGHRAFVWSGGNTFAGVMKECGTVNCFGVTTKSFGGQVAGGSGLSIENFSTSGSPLVYDLNIGFNATIRGGRHELGGQALLQGMPGQPNDNAGLVSVSDTQFEDFRPEQAAPWLGTSPKAMVSLHDASNVSMTNVKVWCATDLGQQLGTEWLELWHSKAGSTPVVSMNGCTALNGQTTVKTNPKLRGGTFRKLIDGTVSTGGQVVVK